jgi:hypothetical protein
MQTSSQLIVKGIDKDKKKKALIRALKEGTSLSAITRKTIYEYAEGKQ